MTDDERATLVLKAADVIRYQAMGGRPSWLDIAHGIVAAIEAWEAMKAEKPHD